MTHRRPRTLSIPSSCLPIPRHWPEHADPSQLACVHALLYEYCTGYPVRVCFPQFFLLFTKVVLCQMLLDLFFLDRGPGRGVLRRQISRPKTKSSLPVRHTRKAPCHAAHDTRCVCVCFWFVEQWSRCVVVLDDLGLLE